MKKTKIIAIAVWIVLLIGLFFLARLIVKHTYSSESLFSRETPTSVEDGEHTDTLLESTNSDYDFMEFEEGFTMLNERTRGIPLSVYNPDKIDARAEEYLGDSYSEYRKLFVYIESNYAQLVSGMSNEDKYRVNEILDENPRGRDWNYLQSCTLEELLNCPMITYYKESLTSNDSGLEAIYFIDDYVVVYKTTIVDDREILLVVDYSDTAFTKNDLRVDYGGILNSYITIYPFKVTHKNIQGVDILFYKNYPGKYSDSKGGLHSVEEIKSGVLINW